ncbi:MULTISPECIES: flagellin [unclassified Methanoculleus]|jgi:flagellar protein FlaG|uniref:flagellin n=1 Tax=unclassified Methanoculleus TaxID=2619537 RepID=UPI0025DC53E4|nr:flagellin [Methanoculleus sp. UBA377]
MSSEAIGTAMFLIAAVISAGVLINAIIPVVYTISGTIASSSHTVDERLSTDVRIVTTYASAKNETAEIWIKNVGTNRIVSSEIQLVDVFLGGRGDFVRLTPTTSSEPDWNEWTYAILEVTPNNHWDPGETLHISAKTEKIPDKEGVVYFQFVLPTGLSRSTTFTASD